VLAANWLGDLPRFALRAAVDVASSRSSRQSMPVPSDEAVQRRSEGADRWQQKHSTHDGTESSDRDEAHGDSLLATMG
jgi:hypothetical protein